MRLFFLKSKIIFLIVGVPFSLFSQSILKGSVEDGEIKKPIIGANIFLSNTTKGTISDETGKFTLKNIPVGNYELVISCVGYETIKIGVNTEGKKPYRIILKPLENKLSEFKITTKRSAKWQRNLELFTNNFIGKSDNANKCKIVNPEVLSFLDSLNIFITTASDLLIIENRGLGYRVKYALKRYLYNRIDKKITYEGYPVFELLTPINNIEHEKWIENRRKAFLGSIRHFMKSLYECNLHANGFSAQRIIEIIDKTERIRTIIKHGEKISIRPTPADSIVRILLPDSLSCHYFLDTTLSLKGKIVSFKGLVQITYLNEIESRDYQLVNDPLPKGYRQTPQVSIIHMVSPKIILEPDGHFSDPIGIISEKYWSWELMSEMLPYDYDIKHN